MAWAEIIDGLVSDIGDQSPGRIECAPEVQVGWSHDGEVFRPPLAPPMPILTRPQFEFLLGVTGLADVWVAVEEAVKPTDPVQYGLLRGLRARDTFRYESTLVMVEAFAPFLPEGVTLDDAFLRPMWLQAAAADI